MTIPRVTLIRVRDEMYWVLGLDDVKESGWNRSDVCCVVFYHYDNSEDMNP